MVHFKGQFGKLLLLSFNRIAKTALPFPSKPLKLPRSSAQMTYTMVSRSSLTLGVAVAASAVSAGPCDIYASGNPPCVAAHSTTRSLYARFDGALYQVSRGSDGATRDIYPPSRGGVANAGSQDSFCDGTTCFIEIILPKLLPVALPGALKKVAMTLWQAPSVHPSS